MSKKEKFTIQLTQKYNCAVHCFKSNKTKRVVLMIHGAVENGRIFYSKSGKGLGPFIADNESDVFIVDLPGRGDSKPHASDKLSHSQSQFINFDFPLIVQAIRDKYKVQLPWHIVAHSWGGVLCSAAQTRHQFQEFKSMVFFGVKRRITVKSVKKLVKVNLYWRLIGSALATVYGYLPAKKMKIGSDDEPKIFGKQIMDWVEQKQWIDHEDGFDYLQALEKVKLPPVLSMTGIADRILGNPQDVKLLLKEIGQKDGEIVILGKQNGHLEDYDHINILTHPNAKYDGYKLALDWMVKHDV